MAIYQPTNITPSTFLGTNAGVIDANDNISVSWQVNGTSALIGFDINIYENTTASGLIATITKDLTSNPFFATDEKGNPRFYICEPGDPWNLFDLVNGNSYKLKIKQYWKNNPYDSGETTKQTVQNSEVVFVTRAKPSVSVSPGSGTLSSVSQTFTGTYTQAQNDALAWVRWVLSDSEGNVLDDTGTIYTGVLSYTYDGFFSGQTYSLKCTVQTSSGAEVSTTNSYAVSYDTAEQAGGISLSCNADDSVTLSWAAGADIPGVPSADDYGTLSGGVLHLAAERSIEWATVNEEAMAFSSPYCFAWRGRIAKVTTVTNTVNSGTWELVKTYTETRTATESHTMSTSAWRTNPSASTTGTRELTESITVSPNETQYSGYASTESPMNRILVGGDYTYQLSAPCIITTNYDIAELPDSYIAYYKSDGGQWIRLTDVGMGMSQPNARTLSIMISTNESAAYDKQVYVTASVKVITQYVGSATDAPYVGDTGVSGPIITYRDPGVTSVVVEYNSIFYITIKTSSAGTYTVKFKYTYTISSDNAYMAQWGGTLSAAGGTLTSASIVSTTATGGASVSVSGNTYTVTEYNANNTAATQTVVRLTYTVQVTGSESYQSVVTVTYTGAHSAAIQSTTAQRAVITGGTNGVYTVTMFNGTPTSCTATIAFGIPTTISSPNMVYFLDSNINAATITMTDASSGSEAVLNIRGQRVAVPAPAGAWKMLAVVRPGLFEVYWFTIDDVFIQSGSAVFTRALPSPIANVILNGEQWCDFVYVSQNSSFVFPTSGKPGWNSDTLFYASFADDLQAGTVGSAEETMSVAIYRREGTTLSPIGIFDTGVKTVRDYAIRSGVEYRYDMFYVTQTIGGPVYSAGAVSSVLCRQFRQHTLIEAEEDADNPGVYHPVNVWRFRDNVDAGGYTNQNQPVLLENFTKYPLWQPSSPAAKTGTLTALLGWFENGEYSHDTAAAMEKLFDLSSSINQLFYRDMKGNLYMVRLSGPISQTINNSSAFLSVSVSVPWVETGDADGVKIYTEG